VVVLTPVPVALDPVPLAASAGSGPLARTRPVAAARAAAATAASRRARAVARPARLGGGEDGTGGVGGLSDTVASLASARVDSPTADCPGCGPMIRQRWSSDESWHQAAPGGLVSLSGVFTAL